MADSKLRKHTSCTCLLCQSCIEVFKLMDIRLLQIFIIYCLLCRPLADTIAAASVVVADLVIIYSVLYAAWTLNQKKSLHL
jgi:hypothetical protein